ncbi:MAG: hypothetical protein JWM11_5657, partial [Planctomycetaceae bacterium]|nr:hypothetical protein [Planctomycetaceae bacterium]
TLSFISDGKCGPTRTVQTRCQYCMCCAKATKHDRWIKPCVSPRFVAPRSRAVDKRCIVLLQLKRNAAVHFAKGAAKSNLSILRLELCTIIITAASLVPSDWGSSIYHTRLQMRCLIAGISIEKDSFVSANSISHVLLESYGGYLEAETTT